MNKANIKNIIFLALEFSFMLFFFAPLEFYFSQRDYFFFEAMEIVPFGILLTIAGTVFISLVALLILKLGIKAYNVIFALVSGLMVTLYIQGNFVVFDYGVLDGSSMDFSQYKLQGIVTQVTFLGVWALMLFAAYKLKSEKYQKLVRTISIYLMLIQIFTLTTLAVRNGGFTTEDEYVSTTDCEYELSEDENVIVLLLDTFDSQAMSEILESEQGDLYRERLADFTYYPDTLGMFSWTDLALPQILTGVAYDNSVTYGEYLNASYEESPLLNALSSDDWSIGIYTGSMLPQGEVAGTIDNFKKTHITVSSHKALAVYMYKLVAFRYLPQPFKQYFVFYSEDMKNDLRCSEDDYEISDDSNFAFYDSLEYMEAKGEEKCFRFYHLDGTHPDFNIDENFTQTSSELTIEDEARGMTVLIKAFTDRLKEIGVYEDSTIIIMADHGYIDSRQCPLLMVKGAGESHDFAVSDKIVSYEDIQQIFLNCLDAGENMAAEDIVVAHEGDRKFNFYRWSKNMGQDSYSKEITAYILPEGAKARESDKLVAEQ